MERCSISLLALCPDSAADVLLFAVLSLLVIEYLAE